jgi:hypothetical protein
VTEQQLYLAIGIPSLVALIGILVNVSYFVFIGARINSLEARLDGRMNSLETKFELLTGKVVEVDNRLTRIEEQLKHLR